MVIGHLINPTDYVLDIGANIGLHTVWFAQTRSSKDTLVRPNLTNLTDSY